MIEVEPVIAPAPWSESFNWRLCSSVKELSNNKKVWARSGAAWPHDSGVASSVC